ncbi:diguanylate cyclase [Halomonas sp. Bachu 37]|uniref:sensor domain-containing diguanylate cyclase n=1 Tax=Halomonas kashgarensis TaxID=3084920 RepID=UPI003217986B
MPLMLISSLRSRFLLALGGVLLMALLALMMIGKWIVLPALLAEERSLVSQQLDRLERSLALNQEQLLAQVRDWATWDDTYEFVQDAYPRYAEVNFSQNMFEEMGYHLMVFFDSDKEVHWIAGLDPQSGRYASCSEADDSCRWAAPYIRPLQASLANDPSEGRSDVYTQPSLAIIASNPILRTDESGPAQGWLFKVRHMDDEFTNMMEAHTGLAVTFDTAAADTEIPSSYTIDEGIILARRLLPSAQDHSMLSLGTLFDRDNYRASFTTFVYALLWTGGLMLLVIATVLLLLERMVLQPLRALTRFTKQLEPYQLNLHLGPRLSHRLRNRNDEIGSLAREFEAQLLRQEQLTDELRELSTHDALTGLPNRRFFDAKLNEAVDAARDTSRPLSVMMLDIDHFKLFNDHYGHPRGDLCLKEVADCMKHHCEPHGVTIARTGGEEFSAILLHQPAQDAIRFAQELCNSIAEMAYPHDFSPVASHLTVSIGVASYIHNETRDASALMSAADEALYQAKNAGRNRVMLYDKTQPINAASVYTHE